MAKSRASKNNSNGKKDFIVVGIGASAGGISALQDFFALMPPDSGMAFVVILHLSPDHESNLAQVIRLRTRIPVTVVSETHEVEPDNIYVISPNHQLELVDGVVRSSDLKNEHGSRVAIDIFFRTLASAYNKNAVCVVMSGTGTDGTLGLKAVKEANGFTIVQSPEDAEYDAMPRSAIATRLVDWILPVREMPERLIQYRDSSVRLHLTGDNGDGKVAKEIQADESLREILTVLRVRTGHDFTSYKTPTLVRRIARQLQIHDLKDMPSYMEFLRQNPEEIHSLLKNLLINVTNFFRDPEAWEVLEREVVPNLFSGKSGGENVRVWSCACASGEEAYSLAMILTEQAERLADPPKIQVFATDVDDEAINQAREHIYTQSIEADVSPERLKRFFVKEGKFYRIKKELRELVMFAPHNVLRDPPFSKLDMISCRNLLIYLNRDTQPRLMEIFHFALAPHGYLFLGNSETAEASPELFAAVDKKQRIYMRRPVMLGQFPMLPKMPVTGNWEARLPLSEALKKEVHPLSISEVHYKLLEKFAPPSVIVNQDFDIQYLSDAAGRYLTFRGGELSKSLLKFVNPDLLPDLRAALFTAQREKKTVEFPNVPATIDGAEIVLKIIVRPVEIDSETSDYLLVLFDDQNKFVMPPETQPTPPITLGDNNDAMETLVVRLEEELRRTKEILRATIEQHEISVEEHKASHEELQAINEELRSTTEELETSKEELQSVNEELTTVNHEHKDKIDETMSANSDLQNLMASTNIATIFLDRQLRIKRLTPPVEQLFNITQMDIGRMLEHFTNKLDYADLSKDSERVLNSLQPVEREIRSADGRAFLTRILPYRTIDDRIEGVVLNFVDITERKRVEDAAAADLRDTQLLRDLATQFVTTVDVPLLYDKILEAAITITQADAGIIQLYDEPRQELVLLSAKNFSKTMTEHFARVKADSKTADGLPMFTGERTFIEFDDKKKKADDSTRQYVEEGLLSAQSTPLIARSGKPIGIFTTHWRSHRRPTERELRFLDLLARQAADLIEQQQAEAALRKGETEFRMISEAAPALVWILNPAGESLFFNDRWYAFTGQTQADAAGSGWRQAIHPEDLERLAHDWRKSQETGEVYAGEIRYRRADGEYRWHVFRALPRRGTDGKIEAWYGLSIEMHDAKNAQEALRESQARLHAVTNLVPDLLWSNDASGATDWYSQSWFEYTGQTFKEAANYGWLAAIHPDEREASLRNFQASIDTSEPFEQEHRIRSANGEYRWFLAKARPFKDESGKIVRWYGAATDLHEQRKILESMTQVEARMQIAVDGARLATWEWNFETNEVYWNERHFMIFGMPPKNKPVQPEIFFRRVHPNDRKRLDAELKKALGDDSILNSEFCVIRRDGSTRWMRGFGRVLEKDSDGRALKMYGGLFDITDRKEAEERLRKNEEQLKLILESTKDYAIITYDLKGRITRWNAGAEKIFGYTEREAVGETTHLIFTPEDIRAKMPETEMENTLKNGRDEDERWHIRKDGSRFYASGVMRILRDEEIEGFVKICRDQTAKLEAEQSALEKEMLRRMVSTQEDERRRIARDIHDQFGQQITALRLKLDRIKKTGNENTEIGRYVDEAQKAAADLDANVDFIAWELRPAALDDLGLRTALAYYINEWSIHSGITAEFHASGLGRTSLGLEVETNLYRIAQEALNNVLKHSKAKQVSVLLEKSKNKVSLIIEDNGVGFNVADKANRKKGIGLVGMNERAKICGGELEIESSKGGGTTIFARIPLKKE
ncbi:MAG TPA: PAS domain S-box protein [Pyrinomonadaceae bacterium]|jgi:PAS domain S-box-containing protein